MNKDKVVNSLLFYLLLAFILFSILALFIWPEKQIGAGLLLFGGFTGLWFLDKNDQRAAILVIGFLISVVITLVNQLEFADSLALSSLTCAAIAGSFLFIDWIRESFNPAD